MTKYLDWKKLLPHLFAVVVIVLVNIAYFYPQLEGKTLEGVDRVSAVGRKAEIVEFRKEYGGIYLWNNSQFGGMPWLLSAPVRNNLLVPAYDVLKLGFKEPIGLFIAIMLMSYLFMVCMGINPYVGLILSVGLGLATGNLQLWEAGHNSKIRTLAFTPIIMLGILYLFEKKRYLVGGSVLAFGLTLSIYTRHPQMTYYIFLIFIVYGIIKLIRAIQSKDYRSFLIPVAIILVSGILALGASASKIWSMYDYNKATMRGEPILKTENVRNTEAKSSSEVKGLDWEYAMSWSNGVTDIIAMYIPGFVGGGSGEKVGRDSESYRAYRMERAPLYWGKLPFTEGPIYFGAVLLFLFVFGLFYIKGDLKLWLGIGVLFAILLSMGKHFAILNKPLFNYLPLYNNFRTPQSILNALIFFIPLLGGLALDKTLKAQKPVKSGKKSKGKVTIPPDFQKALVRSSIVCGGFALLVALLGPAIFSFESAGDARYIQQGADIGPFISDRKALMRADAFRTLILVGICAASLWFYMKRKLSKPLLIGLVGLLILGDMWTVGNRYLADDDFVSRTAFKQNFEPRPVDKQIMQQEKGREYYRVLDLTINTFNSAQTSNFHNTIGGYDPAKLQRFQDLVDRHIRNNNQKVLNMLNTKYFIVNGQNGKPTAQANSAALGSAWFVDEVLKVSSPNEEISRLSDFNPAAQAVVLDAEFDGYIGSFDPVVDNSGSISLTDYTPDHLTYEYNAASEQFVVFSEVWYGPNKGWQAYIDGEPVDHIRANYILRAMRVPAGNHTIAFKYRPKTYYTGEKIALFSSLIVLLLFLGGLGYPAYKFWKESD